MTTFRTLAIEVLTKMFSDGQYAKRLKSSPGQMGLFDSTVADRQKSMNFDPDQHPRAPKGDSLHHGGQFVPKDEATAAPEKEPEKVQPEVEKPKSEPPELAEEFYDTEFEAGEVPEVDRDDVSPPVGSVEDVAEKAQVALAEVGLAEPPKARKGLVEDFGKHVAGARKERAKKTGPRAASEDEKPDGPAWANRYQVCKDARSGKFFIVDMRQKDRWSGSRGKIVRLGSASDFATEEEANNAIPHIEAKRNHRVAMMKMSGDTPWAIVREVGPHKYPVVKGGFATRDEAAAYLEGNPVALIEHKFARYETYQYLDRVERVGGEDLRKGKDIKTGEFQNDFNFAGGQFGNWQSGKDGQTSLNHAYDALADLADALGVPKKAVALDGQLAIAFGARGTGGIDAARAHYEPDERIINLTKMSGAGTLAHEWLHALDHHLANLAQSGKAFTNDTPRDAGRSGLRSDVHQAVRSLHDTISKKTIEQKIAAPRSRADDRDAARAKARQDAIDKGHYITSPVDVADHLWNIRHELDRVSIGKMKKNFKEKLAEFDKVKSQIESGDHGKPITIENANPFSVGRQTFENVEKLNKIHKDITGRGFHTNSDHSPGKRLIWAIKQGKFDDERARQSSEGKTETKTVPTEYAREATHLDSTKTSDYYTLPHEMMARAFESYINDKLSSQGRRNDYLTGKASNEYYPPDMRPFPEGDERVAINNAFDKLFSVLKTKKRSDEHGEHVSLYAKQPKSSPGQQRGLFNVDPAGQKKLFDFVAPGKQKAEKSDQAKTLADDLKPIKQVESLPGQKSLLDAASAAMSKAGLHA